MKIKAFAFRGTIEFVNRRIFSKRDECYGITQVDGRRFWIKLATPAHDELWELVDTLLHEVMHLFFFVLAAFTDANLSIAAHHRVISRVVPYAIRMLRQEVRRSRRRK